MIIRKTVRQYKRDNPFCGVSTELILNVYRMNDYDWWADYSEEEARKNYIQQTGAEESNVDDVEKLSDTEMEHFKYKDEDMDEAITFAEQLTKTLAPGMFASTET